MSANRRTTVWFASLLLLAVAASAEGPSAAFTANAVSGVGALSVWFTDTSDPGTSVISAWAWDFGEDSEGDPFAAIPSPVHQYQAPGTYTVSLTVITPEGTDTITRANLITVLASDVFRVDIHNITGTEDGLGWSTAFNTIQEGVVAAVLAGGGEVWVAQGSYTDSINAGLADNSPGDDYCVVWMRSDIALFGGFSGAESTREERDPTVYPTVINGEGVRRCVIADADVPLTLDGFTLQNGFAAGNPAQGGGMYVSSVPSIGIRRCLFTGNTAAGDNGGNASRSGKQGSGGALAVTGGRIHIAEVIFADNEAAGGSGYNSNLSGSAGLGGEASGGALSVSNATLTAWSAAFNDNTAGGGKGGNRKDASAGKGGTARGGGLFLDSASALLLQCNLTKNTTLGGLGGTCDSPGSSAGGAGGAADGGAISNMASELWLRDSALELNTVLGGQGGSGFVAGGVGGAASGGSLYDEGAAFSFNNCLINLNNVEGGTGGANSALVKAAGGLAQGGGLYLCGSGYECTSSFLSFYGNRVQGGDGQPAGGMVGRSVYFCAGSVPLDEDGDGLLCWFEEAQGCDPEVTDASLWISLGFPSPGASFRTVPIPLSGRVASPEVTPLFRSDDNGNTFADIGVPTSSLAWADSWSPVASGVYEVVIRGLNGFGGDMYTETREIRYQPAAPVAYITSPVHKQYVNGQVSVTGTASAGLAGFGGYILEYRSGETPGQDGEWTLIHSAPSEVVDNLLGTWNVLALPEAWYVIRLRADDGAGTESVTWVAIYIDPDTTPPDAPGPLWIEGVTQPAVIADGGALLVTGHGNANCFLYLAELINENETVIKTVTSELTLHASGALRGTCTMPANSGAARAALRVRYRDLVGNVGPAATSNALVVDNAAPVVTIDYLPDNALVHLNLADPATYVLHGTSLDTGESGIKQVDLRIDDGFWLPATGTDTWTYAWTPADAGDCILQARALDYQGNVSDTASITLTVSEDKATAYITSPASGTSFFSGTLVDVFGSAEDETDFQDYQVQYKNAGDPDWTLITPTPVTTPVHEGLLAQWDTTGLTSPDYLLQLVARDASENLSAHTVAVEILADLSLSGIEDVSLYEEQQLPRHAWLPAFARPSEGAEDYTYTLAAPLPPESMGISIDGENWLHILPATDWFGWADVTVSVDDGAGHTAQDTFRVTVINVNDPPTAPEIMITPALPGDDDALVCQVTVPATDADDDPLQYQYDWYSSLNGIAYTPEPVRSVCVSADYDILAAFETEPGEFWKCLVRAYDGMAYSTECFVDTVRVLRGSTISMNLFPGSLTLGQYLTVSGQIDGLSGSAPVVFTSTKPLGTVDPAYPPAVLCANNGVYTNSFPPNQASEGRTPWQIQAAWNGDSAYRGAQSGIMAFSVNKARPSLQVTLSHTAALLNLAGADDFEIGASLGVPNFPYELQSLLIGRTVRLAVQTPDGQTPWAPLETLTDAEGTAIFGKAAFDTAGIAFDTPGVFKFKAEFPGDDNFLIAATQDFDVTDARVTIKEGAGYAILALGRLDAAAEGHAEHAQTTDYIYDTLLDRGFAPDDIYYLREYLPGETKADTVYPPTKGNLQYAIETWARDKLAASAAPLYIILADHGSPGKFHLDVAGTPEEEYITDAELGQSVSILESSLGKTEPNEIILIYGACYSGSVIPALSGTNRTIITSCAADEISYRGVDSDPNDGIILRDGEFFLMEFFRYAGRGDTLKDAFEQACAKTAEYTASRSNGGASDVPQHPQLDDNGDGVGATGILSPVAGEDGGRVHDMDLGIGMNAGNTVSWFRVSPPVTLEAGGAIGTLVGETTGRAWAEGDAAWLEVKTPAYDGGEAAAPGYEQFQRVARMAGPIAAGAVVPVGGDKYEVQWTQEDLTPYLGGFDTAGTYKVYYFLKDGDTGRAGAYLVTNIYVEKPGNRPPAPVGLLYPTDDITVSTSTFFAWNPAMDPDGDPVMYRLEISAENTFPVESTIVKDGIVDRIFQLEGAQEISDLTRYYWRVIPVDPYGAVPDTNAIRTFTTDNSNSELPGAITGTVTSAETGEGVNEATLTLTPTSLQGTSGETGAYFLGELPQDVYTLTVSAPGYKTERYTDVIVTSDKYTLLNAVLEADGNIPHPADINTDFRMVLGEAIAYLAGWQTGSNPIAYAIRAAYLWQNGEAYTYDSEVSPPLCWVLLP